MAELTEERLATLEARARDSRFGLVPGDEPSPVPPLRDEVLDLIAALREARAERDAAAAEAAALRAVLAAAESSMTSSEERVWEEWEVPPFCPSAELQALRGAIAAPPTAWAAVAAARKALCNHLMRCHNPKEWRRDDWDFEIAPEDINNGTVMRLMDALRAAEAAASTGDPS